MEDYQIYYHKFRNVATVRERYSQFRHMISAWTGINESNRPSLKWISAIACCLAAIADNETGGQLLIEGGALSDDAKVAIASKFGYDDPKRNLGNLNLLDAAKWIGRGLFSLTGRANYVKFSNYIARHPDFVTACYENMKHTPTSVKQIVSSLCTGANSRWLSEASLLIPSSDNHVGARLLEDLTAHELDLFFLSPSTIGIQLGYMITSYFSKPLFVIAAFNYSPAPSSLELWLLPKFSGPLDAISLATLITQSMHNEGYRSRGDGTAFLVNTPAVPSLEYQSAKAMCLFFWSHLSEASSWPSWTAHLQRTWYYYQRSYVRRNFSSLQQYMSAVPATRSAATVANHDPGQSSSFYERFRTIFSN